GGVAHAHRRAPHVETRHVGPMTDAIAGSREDRAISLAHAPQEAVVVRVLVSGLEDVVIHVLRRLSNRNGVLPHLLELEPRERTRRLLEERLIHPECALVAGI